MKIGCQVCGADTSPSSYLDLLSPNTDSSTTSIKHLKAATTRAYHEHPKLQYPTMPTEEQNIQYLYLVLTHGGNPTVCPFSTCHILPLTSTAGRLGPHLRRPAAGERRSNKTLVAPQTSHRKRRQAHLLSLRAPLAPSQTLHPQQGTFAAQPHPKPEINTPSHLIGTPSPPNAPAPKAPVQSGTRVSNSHLSSQIRHLVLLLRAPVPFL